MRSLSPRDEADSHANDALKLSTLLEQEDVLLGIQADRKRALLGSITARLAERVGRRHGVVLAAFLGRERLGPTSIGHGVAIPHAHLDGISAPAAVVATLRRPIAFGSPDDTQVDLVLALLWPKSDSQHFIPALRHVLRLLRRAGLADLLRQSRTPDEAQAWIKSFEEEACG